MKKGTRVEVVKGQRSYGVQGSVFWHGPDKYNEGSFRIGIKDDDGQTHWLSVDDVVEVDEDAAPADPSSTSAPQTPRSEPPSTSTPQSPRPETPASDLKRGMRVRWDNGAGTIFWYGPSRYGDGMRVGVKDDNEASHWLDALEVTPIIEEVSSPPEAIYPQDDAPPSDANAPSCTTAPWDWDASDPGPLDGPMPIDDQEDLGFYGDPGDY